jgi:hypothetical protein
MGVIPVTSISLDRCGAVAHPRGTVSMVVGESKFSKKGITLALSTSETTIMVPHMNPKNVLKEILSKQQPFECPVQVAELQTRFVKVLGGVLKGIISPSDSETLNELLNIAYQRFSCNSCDYKTSLICRALYTDVAITMSCRCLLHGTNTSNEDRFQFIPCLLGANSRT